MQWRRLFVRRLEGRLMATIGDLVISIGADARPFNVEIKKSQGTLKTFASGVGKFASGATKAFAQFGLAVQGARTAMGILSEPLSLADTQIKAERKLEQVFKSTGNAAGFAADEIKTFAAERQKLTNFGDEATIDAAGVLGSFTNIKGEAFTDALVAAQDLSAFLGTDLQSATIQVGKALNDPARGLTALSRSGIQFSESQTETIKKLQEVGMVADAQRLILQEFQKQFGGQAEALADPITQAKNSWGDFLEEVGKGVREITEVILKEFGFENMTVAMSSIVSTFRTEWKDDVVGGIKTAVRVAQDVWKVFQAIGDAISPVIDKLVEMNAALDRIAGRTGGVAKKFGVDGSLADQFSRRGLYKPKTESAAKPTAGKDFDSYSFLKDAGPTIPESLLKFREEQQMEAEKLAESLRTPGEKFQDEIDRLTGLFEGGFISSQLFDRAAQAAVDQLPGSETERARNEVRSLEANSQEAFDVLRANTGPQKTQNEQLKIQKKSEQHLAKIAKEISKNPTSEIEVRGFD